MKRRGCRSSGGVKARARAWALMQTRVLAQTLAIAVGWCGTVGTSASAWSADVAGADLARCAAITAADSRLACYDGLAGRPSAGIPAAAGANMAAGAVAGGGATAAGTTAASAVAVGGVTSAAPGAPGSGTAPVGDDDPHNFGFTQAQLHPIAPGGPAVIHAHIAKISEDAIGNASLVLDSGQTWVLRDGDGWVRPGDAVTIKRAALGSFTMITAANHVYKVHRVQ